MVTSVPFNRVITLTILMFIILVGMWKLVEMRGGWIMVPVTTITIIIIIVIMVDQNPSCLILASITMRYQSSIILTTMMNMLRREGEGLNPHNDKGTKTKSISPLCGFLMWLWDVAIDIKVPAKFG